MTVSVPANCVFTVYPHDGTNRSPTVTEWRSKPDFLTMPASSVQLMCSATDSEMNELSYAWSIISHPEGAQVSLAEPNAAVTRVDGLTVPGDYVFRLEITDPTHTVTVDHTVPVYP